MPLLPSEMPFQHALTAEVTHGTPVPRELGGGSSRRGSRAGLAMVELLVAMAVGLFLMGGILQVMVSSKASYRLGEAEARVQENGRFALQVLASDLRGARSTGCRSVALDDAQGTLHVVACDLLNPAAGETGCTGTSAVGAGTPLGYAASQHGTSEWLASLPGTTTDGAQATVTKQWLRGDVVVSWGVAGQGIYLRSPGSLGDDRKGPADLVQPANANHDYYCDIHKGRLALATDCEATDIFAVSNAKIEDCTSTLSAAKLGDLTSLRHGKTCETDCPDGVNEGSVNASEELSRSYNRIGSAMSPGVTLSARVFPFEYSVFYVCCMNNRTGKIQPDETGGNVAHCVDNPDQYRPSLCRWSTRTNGAEQFVGDVADMRVTYDGYTGQVGGPRFLDGADAAWVSARGYWDRVDSARIQLLATTGEEVRTEGALPNPGATAIQDLGYGLPADRRMYQSFDLTTAIRSNAPWYLQP